MLRNLLIISSSGIVLFTKEFFNAVNKSRLIGGLMTALLDFSTQRVGVPVSYISLSNVGVAIYTINKVTCALFHDLVDGPDFGKLICTEVLHSFVRTFSAQLEEKVTSPDLFLSFNQKIAEVIRNSVRPILDLLQEQRGIEKAVLLSGDAILHSTVDIDKLGVLANHQALLGVSTDIMASKNDVPLSIVLKGEKKTTVLRRIERSSLIVQYSNTVNPVLCDQDIDKAVKLLQRVLNMLSSLQDMIHVR